MLLLEVCGLAAPRPCADAQGLRGLVQVVDVGLQGLGEGVAASFAHETALFDETGPVRRAQNL